MPNQDAGGTREPGKRPRTVQELRGALSMVGQIIWNGGKPRSGEHVWSIPVDQERDFDCILGDGISELIELRARAERAESALAEMAVEIERLRARTKINVAVVAELRARHERSDRSYGFSAPVRRLRADALEDFARWLRDLPMLPAERWGWK